MEFISVRQFRANSAKMWRKLKKEKQLVLTNRGKPIAVVTSTNEQQIGDTMLEIQRQQAMQALRGIQEDAKRRGLSGMSMKEIDQIIAESRRERRLKRH